ISESNALNRPDTKPSTLLPSTHWQKRHTAPACHSRKMTRAPPLSFRDYSENGSATDPPSSRRAQPHEADHSHNKPPRGDLPYQPIRAATPLSAQPQIQIDFLIAHSHATQKKSHRVDLPENSLPTCRRRWSTKLRSGRLLPPLGSESAPREFHS